MNKTAETNDHVLATLFNLDTIRERTQQVFLRAANKQSPYFVFHPEKMESTAAFVSEVIQRHYPNLAIPYHSRWRHFEINEGSKVDQIPLKHLTPIERGTILYELVIISVFLDAGAGANWRYQDPVTNKTYTRSEGLALASLDLYVQGAFSMDKNNPYRVDAEKLLQFSAEDLQQGFQVTPSNPLEGVAGRVALLNKLGTIIQEKPTYFGSQGRLGAFFSYISSQADNNCLSAKKLFHTVLNAFNTIWPTRLSYAGTPLGDVWLYPPLKTDSPGSEFMPFHKLSQWLTYSLIEPLEQSGIQVIELNSLTGLPEYRNGGLLIDSGVLTLKNEEELNNSHQPNSELIVEWRALTVALLDELAILIRKKLQQNSDTLPLAKILQGGTWAAGREIAKQKRVDGTPPIQIISDGTVF